MAQLKAENLMIGATTANGFRAAVSALRFLNGVEVEFPHLHAPGVSMRAASG